MDRPRPLPSNTTLNDLNVYLMVLSDSTVHMERHPTLRETFEASLIILHRGPVLVVYKDRYGFAAGPAVVDLGQPAALAAAHVRLNRLMDLPHDDQRITAELERSRGELDAAGMKMDHLRR